MIIDNTIDKIDLNQLDLDFEVSNDISESNFILFLEKLQKLEESIENFSLYSTFNLSIKQLPFEFRSQYFKKILETKQFVDPISITNVLVLVKSNLSLDDEFFNNNFIFVNDIEEMLDIKLECKAAISQFIKELSIWYVSILRSLHKVEVNFLEDAVDLPNIYSIAINSMSFLDLSDILAKSSDFSVSQLHIVKNAYSIFCKLVDKQKISNALLQGLN